MTTRTSRIRLSDIGSPLDRLPDPDTVEVTVEVMAEDIGDQLQADHLLWRGLIYDAHNDVLEISLGGRDQAASGQLRHAVHAPGEIWREERNGVVVALSIGSPGGVQTVVTFHRRHALGGEPGPSAPLSLD